MGYQLTIFNVLDRMRPNTVKDRMRSISLLELKGRVVKKLHIAISTNKIEESINDYTVRLGEEPCSAVIGEYALWRTDTLNVSIRQDPNCTPGTLRHLGWEDSSVTEFTEESDVNGIVWERFNAQNQANEINELWPQANYEPK